MDLLVLLPAPLITLATAILKFFGLSSAMAPWVALALAIVSTVAIHVFGLTNTFILDIVAFLIAWLGSMGTWEALKNILMRKAVPVHDTAN